MAHLEVALMFDHMKQPERAWPYLQKALEREPQLAQTAQANELLAKLQHPQEPLPLANISFQDGVR